MDVLIGIALKSLLVAGVTLGLLELMKQRSAAERSWVAHIGLLALVIMAVAPVVLPSWNVEAPVLLGEAAPVAAPAAPVAAAPLPPSQADPIAPAAQAIVAKTAPSRMSLSPTAAATVLYGVPAAILLFITFLALARLIALRARADVLVDSHWLSALARAQRRMGFKHGTALLTSNELASPISWGLMRPVILLNTRAVEATGEAEAIIAHELAHVARMDWAKLLLARIATALFWFNPLVWLLAREAHQLREETADDTVLAADIADTDYAQLLVGVARHECPGLLLGAHGVAPSKSSLARRVARVLDSKSVRGPAARSFALGVLTGAILVAAPLAALTLTPGGSKQAKIAETARAKSAPHSAYYPQAREVPTDIPSIIADGVSTAVTAVTPPSKVEVEKQARAASIAQAIATATKARDVALVQAAQVSAQARAVAKTHAMDNVQIDRIIQMKAAGITPEYVEAMRVAAPNLRDLEPANFAGIHSLGVTPQFARDLAAAGLRDLDANELAEARAVGLSGEYARGLAAAGVPPDLDAYVQMRAVGVPVQYVISVRKSGLSVRDPDKIVEMWSVGVKPSDMKPGKSRGSPDQDDNDPDPGG